MKKLILLLILVLSFNIVEASKAYILELNYKDNVITLKNKDLVNGYIPDRKIQPKTGYKLELTSFNNKVLYSFKFELPLLVFSDRSDKNGTIKGSVTKLKQKDFALLIPYFENAKEINIYDQYGVVLTIDISTYSRKTNNLNLVIGIITIVLIIVLFLLFKKK